jgi:hypothetical protein
MRAPGTRRTARGLLGVWLLLAASGCAGRHLGPGAVLIADTPARVEPPTPETRAVVTVAPGALPAEARAHFPALDGDAFIVTYPAKPERAITARQVLESAIEPVLKAIGWSHGTAALRVPPEAGVPQPAPDARRLGRALARESARPWPPPGPIARRAIEGLAHRERPDPDLDGRLRARGGGALAELIAIQERRQIPYPFVQIVAGVPVEGAGLIASRWEGQTISTVSGALLDRYAIANTPRLDLARALARTRRGLGALDLDDDMLGPIEAQVFADCPGMDKVQRRLLMVETARCSVRTIHGALMRIRTNRRF